MSKKVFALLMIMSVLAIFTIPAVIAQDEDVAGTTVTIFGAYTDESEVSAFEAGFADFEEETGIDVVYEGASDFEILINTRIEAGDAPDIAGFPQPGLMQRFADEAIDVTSFLSREYLEEQYNPSWIDMATTADGKVIGVWGRVVVKSLVWYNPQAFDAAGYDVPETWDDFLDLIEEIREDGGVPLSTPMESGAATGWVGTDWIEDIVLRTTSLENYDAWTVPVTSGMDRLPFTSDEIKNAWEIMGDILLTEGNVLGGPSGMLDVEFFDTGTPIVEERAYMAKMGSFMPPWIDSDVEVNIAPDGNLYYFVLPPIDEEYGIPVLTSGDVYSMYNDRPEVRMVMEHLTKGVSLQPGAEAGTFISPHLDSELDWYPEAERGIARILLEADSVRFDGGDLQPGVVGAGSFWQGVVDYIGGTKDLDTILEEVDAAWPEDME